MKFRWIAVASVFILLVAVAWSLTPEDAVFKKAAIYQRIANPGDLSDAHSHLVDNCAACHTPISGADSTKCIACHANHETILQRQPTAFHANVSSCRECHREHQGIGTRPTEMNHEALARIGMRQLKSDTTSFENINLLRNLSARAHQMAVPHRRITGLENLLNCAECHSNDDQHFNLFGNNCSSCHATDRWTIPEYQHPSSDSRDCAHCHQAPPSHYMMHFKMISQRVAGKMKTRVDQCFECHQTTSWNDIKNAGWYKHH